MTFSPPEFRKVSFNCPFCNAYAQQSWYSMYHYEGGQTPSYIERAVCNVCKGTSIWLNHTKKGVETGQMVYPQISPVPAPHQDTPEDIGQIFEEARAVFSISPKASAALLRLALEKLVYQLAGQHGTINDAIKTLVKKGLPERVQKAMDVLRVTGNKALHAGTIDLTDDQQVASSLFAVFNLIVDDQITKVKQVDSLFEMLPDDEKQKIEKRDAHAVQIGAKTAATAAKLS
jgi:hypothetical protein